MNLDLHNPKKMPRRWGSWQRQFGIIAILTLGAWSPAIGAESQCLMAVGMDPPQAGMLGRYHYTRALSMAIRSGQTHLATMILACSRLSEEDLDRLDYYIEMANVFDQDDIKELLKQHRKWLKRNAK